MTQRLLSISKRREIVLCHVHTSFYALYVQNIFIGWHTAAITKKAHTQKKKNKFKTVLNMLLITNHCCWSSRNLKLMPTTGICPLLIVTTNFTSFPVGTLRKSTHILMSPRTFQVWLQNPYIYTYNNSWHFKYFHIWCWQEPGIGGSSALRDQYTFWVHSFMPFSSQSSLK